VEVVEGAGVVELLPFFPDSELVEPVLLSGFDSDFESEFFASAGVPLFSDLLAGSFILSE
jgi:hypothetical protein